MRNCESYFYQSLEYKITIDDLSDHKINLQDIDKIYDFKNKKVLIFDKKDNYMSFGKIYGKIYDNEELVNLMKPDYNLMNKIIKYINLINLTLKPKSLKCIGIGNIIYENNNNYLLNEDIKIKWYSDNMEYQNNNKLITIF